MQKGVNGVLLTNNMRPSHFVKDGNITQPLSLSVRAFPFSPFIHGDHSPWFEVEHMAPFSQSPGFVFFLEETIYLNAECG